MNGRWRLNQFAGGVTAAGAGGGASATAASTAVVARSISRRDHPGRGLLDGARCTAERWPHWICTGLALRGTHGTPCHGRCLADGLLRATCAALRACLRTTFFAATRFLAVGALLGCGPLLLQVPPGARRATALRVAFFAFFAAFWPSSAAIWNPRSF